MTKRKMKRKQLWGLGIGDELCGRLSRQLRDKLWSELLNQLGVELVDQLGNVRNNIYRDIDDET